MIVFGGTLVTWNLFKQCKSAPGNNEASSSNPGTLDDHNVDITSYAGEEKIRFLVTLLDLEGIQGITVMCNGVLVGPRDILTVSKCAYEIALSGALHRYKVRVAEGLDAWYANRLKRIRCVDYDTNFANGINNQLAWIVLQENAAVQVMRKTVVSNIRSQDCFTMQTVMDVDETRREQIFTGQLSLYYEEFTEGATLGLDKVAHRFIKDIHQGITCVGGLFFHVPSKFTAKQILENSKRIMGFLLFHGGITQAIGISSVVTDDGSCVDVYARVNKDLTDAIPRTHRQFLPGYEIPN